MSILRETNVKKGGLHQRTITVRQCPALQRSGIEWIGTDTITGEYEVVRLSPTFAHLTVCSSGKGLSLQDGRWVPFLPGHLAVSPIGAPHGASSIPGRVPWVFHYVMFAPGKRRIRADQAMLVEANVTPLVRVIGGLLQEHREAASDEVLAAWALLVSIHAGELIAGNPEIRGSPSCGLRWPNARATTGRCETWRAPPGLAPAICGEFRRDALGSAPAAHVTRLRLEHAANLLLATREKVETIARVVGYKNAFAFSTAFHRVIGCAPHRFRERRG